MQQAKVRLSEGYGALRAGKLALAMHCFVETLASGPGLSRVTLSNIRQAQRHQQRLAAAGRTDRFLILPPAGTPADANVPVRTLEAATGQITWHDQAFHLQGQSPGPGGGMAGSAWIDFAARHPASHVHDTAATVESVLLGCCYRLLWRTQVFIAPGPDPAIALDNYLGQWAAPSVLAQIAMTMGPELPALIEQLGSTTNRLGAQEGQDWPQPYTRLGAVHQQLQGIADEPFLSALFSLSMERQPEPHERQHYLERLQQQPSERATIVRAVCQSQECQQRMRDRQAVSPHVPRVYALPQIGDLGPLDVNLPGHAHPVVSVLIPVYGKVEYTLACLQSIANNPPQAPFEVIVVDDASPDGSAQVLQRIQNLRLIRNRVNLGFLRSCNHGASSAKGEYLLFLNNDTQVQAGWLDELLATFTAFPGCGLAGSKLLYPDGTLQEAGGIIWQDGSAWNYGHGQDPALPHFNYAREVDYVSGAAIMVPTALFSQLGGFDEIYAPAYCEDADLALKIRDLGLSVIYQPLSQVVHFEGVTSGTDTRQGVKANQVRNSHTLHQRWQSRLAKHRPNGQAPSEEKDRAHTARVLVIEHCTPTPNQDAGSVTVYNLLLLLREMQFQVTFIPEDNFLYLPEYTPALQRMGIEVLYAPYVTSVEQHLKEEGARYDLAFLFRPGVVERHVQALRQHSPQAKVLYHTVDLHYLRMSREAQLQADSTKQQAAQVMQQREFAAIRAADASIVHSTVEFDILRPQLPQAALHVFPLILEVQSNAAPLSKRRDIVFVGGYQHTPNVDAVHYFVAEVMPLLRKQLPGVCFYAVGSKPPPDIQALAAEDVIITGFVEALTPLLDNMRVSVAPLRYGAGIKGKIGTAMAVGLPVVGTALAAEGMSLTHGDNILIADEVQAFADAVTKVYQDPDVWHTLSQNGLAFADQAWGSDAAWSILNTILQSLGMHPVRRATPLRLYSSNPGPSVESLSRQLPDPTGTVCY